MDKYMSAVEAVEYGLVDKILQPYKTQPELLTREKKGTGQEADDKAQE
jgi:hypothetical protein